jgi:hypothetical protein
MVRQYTGRFYFDSTHGHQFEKRLIYTGRVADHPHQ